MEETFSNHNITNNTETQELTDVKPDENLSIKDLEEKYGYHIIEDNDDDNNDEEDEDISEELKLLNKAIGNTNDIKDLINFSMKIKYDEEEDCDSPNFKITDVNGDDVEVPSTKLSHEDLDLINEMIECDCDYTYKKMEKELISRLG